MLAILLLHGNAVVSSDTLIDGLWNERTPTTAPKALQVYVSALRKLLSAERLDTREPGYLLHVEDDELDVARFERLCQEARGHEPEAAAVTLAEALSLWRGPPLADFAYDSFAQGEIARLEELRLGAFERRIEAELACGRHAEVVGELEALIGEHPLRERLREQLILALYRCRRQADALEAYRKARHTLVEETGVEPSPALKELQKAILAQDTALAAPAASTPPQSRGEPLSEPAPAREERKLVSVLFAELGGLYGRSSSTDPEDVRAALKPYHACAKKEIERLGGTVERFVGETVMGFFGVPAAHEDDAERAVRAALRLAEALGELGEGEPRLAVRAGVETGEAIVSIDQTPSEVVGAVVENASRLKDAARPGGVVVGPLTYRATKDVVEYEELASKPLGSWRAIRACGYPHHDRAERTPFIGRQDELALLEERFKRTAREPSVQLVTVTGEPGIGKSRLIQELRGALDRRARWRLGRCLPYGEGISFWALGEIVKAEAAILESDDPESTAQKLRQTVASHVADPAEARWLERHLRPLVGLSAEEAPADDRRYEAFAAWRRFLEVLAEESPFVAVFEDLHFADGDLLDFVDHLVEWASGVPLLVLCTARPELIARRRGCSGSKENTLIVSLPPLSNEQTAELLRALLEQPLLDAKLQATLLQRAEGNPLYAEELAGLVLAGRDIDELPETVHGLIAARLDALDIEEKELLQDASVIGNVFWVGAAVEIGSRERQATEFRLHELGRKEFLRREPRSSVAGEIEYCFRHQLVRDVAYGQIPRGRRSEKHRLAAKWIETLGRHEDQAEMLAHHYLAALELARADGQPVEELKTPARLALRDAGERAMGLNVTSAARFFAAALELWPLDDSERPRLLFGYGNALRIAEGTGDEVLREAYDALAAAGDHESAAEADVLLASLARAGGRGDQALKHVDRAAALAAKLPPSRATAHVLSNLSTFRMLTGEYEEAIRLGLEALTLAKTLGFEEIRAHALDNIGVARVGIGDAGGIADIERSLKIALGTSPRECARAYANLGAALQGLGDLRRARELTVEALHVDERFGDTAGARFLWANLAQHEFWAGRWDEALRLADEYIAAADAGLPHVQEVLARWSRGVIRLARGEMEAALTDAERGIEIAREAKFVPVLAPALAYSGRSLLVSGHVREAALAAEEALVNAREDAVLFAHGWADLALTFTALGRGEELVAAIGTVPQTPWIEAARLYALSNFEGAAELYAEMGSLPDEADARLRAAEQLLEAGRVAEADAQLEQALGFYRSVGATRYIREGEALLVARG